MTSEPPAGGSEAFSIRAPELEMFQIIPSP